MQKLWRKNIYKCDNKKQLVSIIKNLPPDEYVTCPYYDIKNEYRAICYKNKIYIQYKKQRTTSWKHNLCEGAIPINTNIEDVNKIALNCMNKLQLDYGAVDIIEANSGYMILEVNSKCGMTHYIDYSKENQLKVVLLLNDILPDLFQN